MSDTDKQLGANPKSTAAAFMQDLPSKQPDGSLVYGSCCLNPLNPCPCQRYGDEIRALGYHPVASQRVRDIVTLSHGYLAGSLVPVTNGQNVELWAMADRPNYRRRVLMSVGAWRDIGGVANDLDYDYQETQ